VTTTAWFHCFAGIAGDMALGALIDAGADVDAVREIVGRLPVGGWSLDVEPVLRGGVAATHAIVTAHEHDVVRTYANIAALLDERALPERVRDRAHRIFAGLAAVEGRLHRRPPEQVHFHEVGGIDAIVDIVGVCAALEILDVETVCASEVRTGTGMVRTAHGLLPNPAPAVVELLRGAPVRGLDLPIELTTPTGAAILAALSAGYGPLPAMTITTSGFGAGSHEVATLPNVTQVVVGSAIDADGAGDGAHPVVVLEANVDDVTGEVVAHAIDALLAAGALDAWTAPVTMKKGRPALVVAVIADVADATRLRDVLAAETGSFGVRMTSAQRWPYARWFTTVAVDGHDVRVKHTGHRHKAEFEDAARVARATGRPVRDVIAAAEALAGEGGPGTGDTGGDDRPSA